MLQALGRIVHGDAFATALVAGVVVFGLLGGIAWSNAVQAREARLNDYSRAHFVARDRFFLISGLCFLALGLLLFSVRP